MSRNFHQRIEVDLIETLGYVPRETQLRHNEVIKISQLSADYRITKIFKNLFLKIYFQFSINWIEISLKTTRSSNPIDVEKITVLSLAVESQYKHL